jgi:4-hydroxy-2-oxoheptanedioate aldolase
MRISRVRAKLRRGEPALCAALCLADPSVFELTSLMGFDGIWMDLEHHGASLETASQLMRAARVGTADIIARPAKGEFMRMSRMLEMGAQGIMYPRCDSAAEAAEVVKWAKFAPEGQRGFDGGNPDGLYTAVNMRDYLVGANRETFVIIQLEHQQAIEQADEIAAVPGVDALMIGPADYSILSGFPGQFDHPQLQRSIKSVASAALRAGKHWACLARDAEAAKTALELKAGIIFHFCDLVAVKNALEQVQRQFAPLGFSFDNAGSGNSSNYRTSEPNIPAPHKPPAFLRVGSELPDQNSVHR